MVGPLTSQDVDAMGLALGPVCVQAHGRAMRPHRHIALPAEPVAEAYVTHECPVCGNVHLPSESGAANDPANTNDSQG